MMFRPSHTASRPYQFKRRFLSVSLLVITIATIVCSILMSRLMSSRMLAQDAQAMQAFVHSIVKVEQASRYFLDWRAGNTALEEFFAHLANMPDVARANVYSKERRMLWSSEPDLIGSQFASNPELELALAGETQIHNGMAGDHDKAEHAALGTDSLRFVEIYIPVKHEETGEVIGVVEIYRLPNTLFAAIEEGQQIIWIGAIACAGFLVAALFSTVHRADQHIRSQRERLVEAETMSALGEVASAVAHGIRNPLASIRSSAELWHDAAVPGIEESARDIMSEIDRLERWVRELLTYSQPIEDQVTTLALLPVIQESVAGFIRESERRDISIRVDVNEGLPCVAGDPALLVQAFNNLIANSLEATAPGGRISVTASSASDRKHVALAFADNGAGIAPERMSRVGASFYTTKQKGLGVGLALVQRIVSRSGGRVVINSRQGVGTTVTLFLLRAN